MLNRLLLLAAASLATLALGQELRAWQDINFADPPDVVLAKMVALQDAGTIRTPGVWAGQRYASIARFPESSFYPIDIAGVDATLRFHFNDGKLYRLVFNTRRVDAGEWDSRVLPEYRRLREVLIAAQGAPSWTRSLGFLDLVNGFVQFGDAWESGGVTRRLGITSAGFTYDVQLDIQWDWMVNLIAEAEGRESDQSLRDAAGGF